MKRKVKTARILGVCIILCVCMIGCSKKDKVDSETSMQNMEESIENQLLEKNIIAKDYNSMDDNTGMEEEVSDIAETNNEIEKSGEGKFYGGANLSGRVVEFSDEGFKITPRTIIINEDGTMEGGVAAPGYESEEDNITITYKEDTEFQIVYFSMSSQAESSREDTDKSSIKKETDVEIFGTCHEEKHWIADKVVITRWQ